MRPFKIVITLLTVAGFALVACSQDPSSNSSCVGGGGGSGGSGGSAAPAYCDDVSLAKIASVVCDGCFHRECCAQLARCAAAGANSSGDTSLGDLCLDCGSVGPEYPECNPVRDLAVPLRRCVEIRCQPECFPDPYGPIHPPGTGGGGSSSSSSGG